MTHLYHYPVYLIPKKYINKQNIIYDVLILKPKLFHTKLGTVCTHNLAGLTTRFVIKCSVFQLVPVAGSITANTVVCHRYIPLWLFLFLPLRIFSSNSLNIFSYQADVVKIYWRACMAAEFHHGIMFRFSNPLLVLHPFLYVV